MYIKKLYNMFIQSLFDNHFPVDWFFFQMHNFHASGYTKDNNGFVFKLTLSIDKILHDLLDYFRPYWVKT